MGISRRSALKAIGLAAASGAATTVAPRRSRGASLAAPPDAVGMLYDSTRCVGCKACMAACNQANDLPPDTGPSDGRWQMPVDLNEKTKNIIKLHRDPRTGAHAFVKHQCMHCLDPACASACMLGAYKKREFGIVTYDPGLCVGCRYCEMACPFNIPKFEWAKAMPKMVKCELCNHRIAKGQIPACCEVCPTGAVIYGKYAELLQEAHRRLKESPERYIPKVYGETEVGGTQVLYLAGVEFEKLGLPAYGDRPVPETVRTVQHTVYQGFIAPIVAYGLLAAVMLRNQKRGGHPRVAEDNK